MTNGEMKMKSGIYLALLLVILLSSHHAQSSIFNLSCRIHTQSGQTFASGQANLSSTIEGSIFANNNSILNLSADELLAAKQIENEYCITWAESYLNNLPTSVLSLGAKSYVFGSGYITRQNASTELNIEMLASEVSKTSLP